MARVALAQHVDGGWSVFVDGRCVIDRDTFTVADGIMQHLAGTPAHGFGERCELCEVADGLCP